MLMYANRRTWLYVIAWMFSELKITGRIGPADRGRKRRYDQINVRIREHANEEGKYSISGLILRLQDSAFSGISPRSSYLGICFMANKLGQFYSFETRGNSGS